jgi:hypothetical protein
MAERVAVRDISNEEGNKLLSIIRRGSGSVVRWRRAQIVLWSAQHMDVPAIAKIAFTSEDRVREVIHNFNPRSALRYFCLDGTDHQSHEAQAFLIRRYIAWRNRNAQNKAVRELVKRANVAGRGTSSPASRQMAAVHRPGALR